MPESRAQPQPTSAWSPLRQPLFRSLWMATVASNIGTWMHDVGGVWFMTSLTPSPIMVALMQTATSLPFFLLALPAGALADIMDRRRLLLLAQGWMVAVAAALGLLTLVGVVTPWLLLTFTFALGLGAAMTAPAWQAITPELVSREALPAAVALSGVGINLARAIGPALGGLIVAAAGSGAVFLLNAASFVGVMLALARWRRPPRQQALPPEHVLGAMRAGMRYVRHAPAMQAVLVRCGLFILCGAALWALLPLVARREMGLDAIDYGGLLGSLGVGAISGAAILPRVRQRLTADRLVVGATVLFAGVTGTLAFLREFWWLCLVMLAGGAAWMALMSSFNVAAQAAVPSWVRARGLALYMLVFQGGMAAGSALWGGLAVWVGISAALICAAAGLIAGLAAATRYRLVSGEIMDLTPSSHWPEPLVVAEIPAHQGPVLVTVQYAVARAQAANFVKAMRDVRLERLRDGAMRWDLFYDAADPSRYVETFLVESWVEHLRHHERVTLADLRAEARAWTFLAGPAPPTVTHLISAHGMGHHSTAGTLRAEDGQKC